MRGIKPFKLGFLTRPFQWGAQHHLGVSVLAFFSFEPHGKLFTDVEMWELVANELGATPLEVGIPKSRSEFVVSGQCFQPGGRAAPTCPVKVRVGALEKTLYVIGDRYWLRGVPTEPRPFTTMPLDWAHAFGGEGYANNPLGLGFAPITDAQGRELHPLPNVEAPSQMVRSPKDRPEPAGLGVIDFMWPQRASMAGTYDAQWLKTRYPGFAADLNWRMWNVAAPDQQQEAPFRGDEALLFENLHPDKSRLEARLPGLRGRAFITKRPSEEAPPVFEEVELKLTTVWLFPHVERGIVIFQGATPVREDDGADVDTIMVAAERLDAPRPREHYQRVFERRTSAEARDNPAIHLEDADLVPEGQEGLTPETERQMELLRNEGLQAERARARMAREVANARARLVEMELDPDEHGPPELGPAPEPVPLTEMGAKLVELKKELEKATREAEERKKAELERVAQLYTEMGLDFDVVREEIESPPSGPPTFSADAIRAQMRQLADESAALGQPIEELEFYATDEGFYEHLRTQQAAMVQAYRLAAHHQQAAPRIEAEAALARKDELAREVAAGRSLAGWDLTGADLSGLDLSGADLRDAFLESANLERANLRAARLDNAVLAHADLTGAQLAGAQLSGANLGRAKLATAQLDGVDLSETLLWATDLRGASLRESRMDGAMLVEMRLSHADFSGASIEKAVFLEADLRGCRFTGARMEGAIFFKADLNEVDLGGAALKEATFVDCKLDGASFVNAQMHNARCMGSEGSWRRVDFKGAQLAGANLRALSLDESDFSGACLDKADLSEASLRGARFYRAVARDSLWIKADLRGAFMVSIDLLRAIVQKADLRGTDLRGANLYAADFALVRSDAATNVTDANQGKVRTLPLRASS